jgi:hypothetical protein
MYFVHDLVYFKVPGTEILPGYQQKYASFFVFNSLATTEQNKYYLIIFIGILKTDCN